MRRRTLAYLAIAQAAVLLAGAGTYIAVSGGGEAKAEPSPAAELRAAELIDPAGAPISLPVGERRFLLNFWATWCPPCIHEMPLLDEAASGAGVPVYGVAVDEPGNVAAFLEQRPVGYPILVAGLNGGLQLAKASGNETSAMPYTAVIEADGSLGPTYTGSFSSSEEVVGFFAE